MTCKNRDNELNVIYFPKKFRLIVVLSFDNRFFTFLYRNQIGNIELMYSFNIASSSKLDDQ